MKENETLKKEIAGLKLLRKKHELLCEQVLRWMPNKVEVQREFRKTEEGRCAPYEGLDAVIEHMNRERTAAARGAKTTELDRLTSDRERIRKW